MENQRNARQISVKQLTADSFTFGALDPSGTTVISADNDGLEPVSDQPVALNEETFRQIVIPRAALSVAACQLAVTKCANANAKEFAGFELAEATAVIKVLKELGTPEPFVEPLTLDQFRVTPAGSAFDKLFLQTEHDNHVFLQELTENYLQNAASKTSYEENQVKRLATVALAAFQEHTVITQRILTELAWQSTVL